MAQRPETRVWSEALARVDELLQRSEADRARALADLAVSRPQLHSLVASLISAEHDASKAGFLEPSTSADSPHALAPGAQLGAYRILSQLGAGGMGEVWLAQRVDGLYEGEVAIKTLHPYFAVGALRERFLREANLLGRLTHPNIARLLDAGVSVDGVVYLVLEYVRGVALDAWCDERALSVEARLRLFLDVCAAVAHAHANLIVHRDIKPANILVTEGGVPKLLDFGVAKLVEDEPQAQGTELTRLTGRIFTPEYAAPEQILGEAVTTATDGYSLGVLLHTLLTGARPYGAIRGARELERAILHDEPVRASRSVIAANDAAEIAAKRSTAPRKLQRALAGDLESIIARALRKIPAERYGSVLDLAEDVRRHCRHEPVHARRERLRTRAKKFARRHRVGVAAGVAVVVAVAAGVTTALWQARVAQEEARHALLEARKAEAVKDFLVDLFKWNDVNHAQGAAARLTTAEQMLAQGSKRILTSLQDQPEVRDDVMDLLGRLNFWMERYEEDEHLQRERLRYLTAVYGPDDARLVRPLIGLGPLLRRRGEYDEAHAVAMRALAILDAHGMGPTRERGVLQLALGQIATMRSAPNDSTPLQHYLSAVAILEQHPPGEDLVDTTAMLARVYATMGRYEEAIETSRRGIELASLVMGPRSVPVAGANQQLAAALARMNRLDEAELHQRKALELFTHSAGPDSAYTAAARLSLARLDMRRGRHRQAVAAIEEVLSFRVRTEGTTNYYVQETRTQLAEALIAIGQFARAAHMLESADAVLRDHPRKHARIAVLTNGAILKLEQRAVDAALRDAAAAMQLVAETLPANDVRAIDALLAHASALAAAGRMNAARSAIDATWAALRSVPPDPSERYDLELRLLSARIDAAEGRGPAALGTAQQLIEALRSSAHRAELWPLEARVQEWLAEAHASAGRTNEGCAALDEAIRIRAREAVETDPRLVSARKKRASCRTS